MDTLFKGRRGFLLHRDPSLWFGKLGNKDRQIEVVIPFLDTQELSVHPVIPITQTELEAWSSIQTNPTIARINKILSMISVFNRRAPLLLVAGVLLGIVQIMQSQSMLPYILGVCFAILVLLGALFLEAIYREKKKQIRDEKEKIFLQDLIKNKQMDSRLIYLLAGPTKFALIVE